MPGSLLNTLPPPPAGKTGWPWDVEIPRLPEAMPDGTPWPSIGIVTPSYNQGAFLEETIRSVLLQGYPNLEYVVIDGGSTDESVEIIRKYAPWLTDWVSERDQGQSDAIMKGYTRTTAELKNWLNSDDYYLPGALQAVALAFARHPEDLIIGQVINFQDGGAWEMLIDPFGVTLDNMVKYWEGLYRWHQPGVFFSRQAYDAAGGLDVSLHQAMDHDLLCRLLRKGLGVTYVKTPLVRFRLHATSKTCAQSDRQILEWSLMSQRYWSDVPGVVRAHHDAHVFGELLRVAFSALLHGDMNESHRLFRTAFEAVTTATPWRIPAYLCRYAFTRFRRFFLIRRHGVGR